MLFKKRIMKYIVAGLVLGEILSPIYTYALINNNIVDEASSKTANVVDWELGLRERPTSFNYGEAVTFNGKIYTANIQDDSNATIEIYDPIMDAWETVTALPDFRRFFAMCELDGKIYFIGGESKSDYHLSTVDIYDIRTNSWSTGANMNTGRSYASAVAVNGKIYCMGGRIQNSQFGGIEVYDPIKNKWTDEGDMLTPRERMSIVAHNNKIYCAGGIGEDEWVDTFDVYDTVSKTWEVKPSMSEKKHDPAIGYYDDCIYLVCGEWDTEPLSTIEVYDISTNSWTIKENAPWAISSMAFATINNKLYLVGGWTYDVGYNSNTIAAYIMGPSAEDKAEELVKIAETTLTMKDISDARYAVNQLGESYIKDALSHRLNSIFAQVSPVEIKSVTSNSDIYIIPKNILSMSLNTNFVTFEDFDGIEDIEKLNAVTLSVESSLPYELNVSLESEITNSKGTEIANKNVLSLRESSQDTYKNFTSVGAPLNLLDNQEAGKNNIHGIDIKLNKGVLLKTDIYKTTIKYEVKQK